ncbi:MAG: hypothetical protein AB8H86_26370 [Polyangiales bacterium]
MISRLPQVYAVLLGTVVLSACTVDLGECNDPVARRVVYDPDGFPAYEGQALVATSCGNVFYCHSSIADPEFRYGATVGFDFDIQLGETPEDAERLRQAQANVLEYRDDIYCEVQDGRMPPFGEATLVAHEEIPRYRNADGERIPFIDSFEGLNILRGWLACDAPVIERTTPHPDGATPVGDVVPRLTN